MIAKIRVVFGCILMASGLFAETMTWVSTGTGDGGNTYWMSNTNWRTSSGATPQYAPTNGQDIVLAAVPTNIGGVVISTGGSRQYDFAREMRYPMVNPKVKSLTGGNRYTITHNEFLQHNIVSTRYFTADDFSGYTGAWKAGNARATWVFSPIMFSQTMSTMFLENRPELIIPQGVVTMKDVVGRGMLVKYGDGGLKIGVTSGADTSFDITGGEVEFTGGADNVDLDALLKSALLDLDASNRDSMETMVESGRISVKKWNDSRNNGYYASVPANVLKQAGYICTAIAPYLGEKSSTGLDLVSFGTCGYFVYTKKPCPDGTYTQYGPTNCYLTMNIPVSNVVEVIYCMRQSNDSAGGCATVMDNEVRPSGPHYFQADGGIFVDRSAPDEHGYEVMRIRQGEIRYNGLPISLEKLKSKGTGVLTNLFVMGLAPNARNSSIWSIGGLNNRNNYYAGGMRIAEIIAFSNTLTTAERRAIDTYLMAKWKTGERLDITAANMVFSNQVANLSVAAGKTARIHSAYVPSKTIKKSGSGVLAIENLYPSGANVTVNEGEIAFGSKIAAVSTSTPPINAPSFWVDAEDPYSLETFTSSEHTSTFVNKWKDKRTETHSGFATSYWGETDVTKDFAAVPTLVEEDGHRWVDFGNQWATPPKKLSFMNMTMANTNSYAGFIVIKQLKSNNENALFGSSTMDLYHFSYPYSGSIVGTWYVQLPAINATWTVNGQPRDGLMPNDPDINQNTRPFVLAFSGNSVIRVDQIAALRGGVGSTWKKEMTASEFSGARMRVGEMILYDRPITLEERTQVEAYLMKKWLNEDHPAATKATKLTSLTFSDEIPQTLATEGELKVDNLSGGNGSLVKKGAGTVVVNPITSPIGEIKVLGGKLTLDFSLSQTPAFQFDAMNTAAMTLERDWVPETPATVADTAPRTNVIKWASSVGDGVYADYVAMSNKYAARHIRAPTLRNIEVKTGVVKPMVDFGYINGGWPGAVESEYGVKDGTGMWMNKRFTTSTTKIAEVHTIFGDTTPDKNRWRSPVASYRDNAYPWYRGDGPYSTGSPIGSLFSRQNSKGTGTYATVVNGLVMKDGTVMTPNQITNEVYTGIHLVSVVPLATQPIDALAFSGEQSTGTLPGAGIGGGCRIGEQIAFYTPLTEQERRYVIGSMMNKWFDVPNEMAVNFSSVELANGGELDVGGNYVPRITIGEVSGSGRINCNFAGLKAMKFDCLPNGNWTSATVVGTVEFDDDVTVNLNAGTDGRIKTGAYQVFTAGELINVDIPNWKITTDGDNSKIITLVLNGNSINVKVSPRISVMVVR